MSKVLIVHYSMHAHIHKMVKAFEAGVCDVPGCEANIIRISETLTDDMLGVMGDFEALEALADSPIATAEDIASADAIILMPDINMGSCN